MNDFGATNADTGAGFGNLGGATDAIAAPSLSDFKASNIVSGSKDFLDSNSFSTLITQLDSGSLLT